MIFHYIVDAKKKLLAGLSISRGEVDEPPMLKGSKKDKEDTVSIKP